MERAECPAALAFTDKMRESGGAPSGAPMFHNRTDDFPAVVHV
jgi:hypothetical protein